MNRDTRRGMWVKWFPEHILSSSWVGQLSIEEEGAYRRLLDYNYRDGSIPIDDEDELMYMVKIRDPGRFRSIWKKIQCRFPRMRNSKKGCNSRARTEICWIHERSITNSNNSKQRWVKELPNATASQEEEEKIKSKNKRKSKRKSKNKEQEEDPGTTHSLSPGHSWFTSLSPAGQKKVSRLMQAFADTRQGKKITDGKREKIFVGMQEANQEVMPEATTIFLEKHKGKPETYFFGILRRLAKEV